MVEAKHYDTQALSERVTDLSVVAVDDKELELLLTQYRRQTRGLEDIKAQVDERGEIFFAIRLRWQGKLRGPLGLSINGLEVAVAAFGGVLFAADKTAPNGLKRVGYYLRLSDDNFGEISQQDMLVFWSAPTDQDQPVSFL